MPTMIVMYLEFTFSLCNKTNQITDFQELRLDNFYFKISFLKDSVLTGGLLEY